MKSCPKCMRVFSSDARFCADDGSSLRCATEGTPRSIPLDRSWLVLLLIVALALFLGVGAVVAFLIAG